MSGKETDIVGRETDKERMRSKEREKKKPINIHGREGGEGGSERSGSVIEFAYRMQRLDNGGC